MLPTVSAGELLCSRCQSELEGIISILEMGNKGKRLCQPLGNDPPHSSLGKTSTFPDSADRNSHHVLAGSLAGSTLGSLDQCRLVKTTPRGPRQELCAPLCVTSSQRVTGLLRRGKMNFDNSVPQ